MEIPGVRGRKGQATLFFKTPVKAGHGVGTTARGELNPENDEAGMRVAPVHVEDEPDLIESMLVGMVMGSA